MNKKEITNPDNFKKKVVLMLLLFALVIAGLNGCSKALSTKNKQEFLQWQYSE